METKHQDTKEQYVSPVILDITPIGTIAGVVGNSNEGADEDEGMGN